MEAPPFDVEVMLGKEFSDRADWKDVLREADRLARELDENSILPYRVEKDKLIAVNKNLKKHALWSEERSRGAPEGGSERIESKNIETEA
eukprot:g8756.t4